MDTIQETVSNGLAIVSIPVKDQERSKRFYNAVLGFPITREADFRPDAKWIELNVPGTKTNIALVTWFENMPPGGVRGMVLLTDNLDRSFETLEARGLKTSAVQTAPWGRYLTFSDPDGNGWVMNESRA
ncbi:MAG TPA: VOC family protein [Bryobacteraceae bacterium]|jgi:catechol 2,3-dioxygenase-like lactoylglutathione lyase family enzyme|nr:VOC family protein [Bryobacteraceae bacterium]